MDAIPQDILGPKMLALRDDRRRKFAWIMACGELSASEAARQAGYADPGADSACVRVRGHLLMHDQKVLDAIEEASRKVLQGLAPLAVRQAKAVLLDAKHPQHARMIETVLDRIGFSAKTEHKVTVEHKVDTRELEDLARRLAAESGIDPRRLLGSDAKLIEGEVV